MQDSVMESTSALCLVLVKAYRGQLWKGKQKNERMSNSINLFKKYFHAIGF
jgi:hypothetical protein